MLAAIYLNYGSPDVVKVTEVAKPQPKQNEVLVKVHASSVNRTDCGFRAGKPYIVRLFSGLFTPKQKILGSDFAGEVKAIGTNVKSFHIGDKVFGFHPDIFGAHAQYICLPEDASFTHMPPNTSFQEAAAICEGAHYAMNYLKEINFKKHKKILINGATGAIGTAAVQLAKYFGAEVTTVGNTKNMELVKSLGADIVIDYQKEDFTRRNHSFDVVLDAVGKSTFFKCTRILNKGGIYFSTELGPYAQNIFLPLYTSIMGDKKMLFPLPKHNKKEIIFFRELIEAGHYRAVIDRQYPLAQIQDAYRYVETGEKTGSVVITVEH
ncbi:MAG: NAD(P)-dependent alcohol dehydrogenase [Saprospiraceae bacterium]|nr:NAD(P)-dependent alcohol dehydrogenase [Saprospiraceae bacterium]